MIELLLGMLGICVMISFVAGLEWIWERIVSGDSISKKERHRQKIQRKRAARYVDIRHKNDWRDVA